MWSWYDVMAQATDKTPPPTQEQVDGGLAYVIAAYAVVWLLIFGYLFLMNRRQSQLNRELTILKQELADLKQELAE